jgi:hypothetical protein
MCTVSWLHSDNKYILISNRDEKTTRSEAIPPAIRVSSGVRFLSPLDAAFGGTWIALNERGLSLALLNGVGSRGGTVSRGHVITSIAHAGCLTEAESLIRAITLERFAPFILLTLSGAGAAIFRWTGKALLSEFECPARGLLTSSSFDDDGVRAARERVFERASFPEPFHRSHAGGKNARSVCMHRPDAKTVSLTRIDVGLAGSFMSYQPGSPCEGQRRTSLSIPRK